MASKAMKAAPGTSMTGAGKTTVRTTLQNPFGKRAGKRASSKRGGRSR